MWGCINDSLSRITKQWWQTRFLCQAMPLVIMLNLVYLFNKRHKFRDVLYLVGLTPVWQMTKSGLKSANEHELLGELNSQIPSNLPTIYSGFPQTYKNHMQYCKALPLNVFFSLRQKHQTLAKNTLQPQFVQKIAHSPNWLSLDLSYFCL